MDIPQWLQDNRGTLITTAFVVVGLMVARRIYRRICRLKRDRRPVELNPKLQKYAGRTPADQEAVRLAAGNIIATSSTGQIAGYEIVRQIEAVFVEGHRLPEEAVAAVKSAAGGLGANAIINLTHQRTAAGRCAAQGDAVVVRAKAEKGESEKQD
jgi:uncharacterized protein YbjQ (UPF0145 family)